MAATRGGKGGAEGGGGGVRETRGNRGEVYGGCERCEKKGRRNAPRERMSVIIASFTHTHTRTTRHAQPGTHNQAHTTRHTKRGARTAA